MISRADLKDRAKQIFSANRELAILGFLVSILISCISFKYDVAEQLYQIKIFFFNITVDYSENIFILSLVFSIISILVFGPLKIGLKNLYLNLGADKNTNMSYILAPYKDGLGRTLCYMILKGLIFLPIVVMGVMLIFIINIFAIIAIVVATIIVVLGMSQADYYFVRNKEMSPVECIKQSFNVMSGNKGELFVLQLSFILWNLLVVVTFGIAGIYVYPYEELTYVEFFKSINGEEI